MTRSIPFVLALITAALVSGAASAPPDIAPGVTVEKNRPATMRDGVILRADVYRPTAPGTYPVLLQRTPYSKNDEEAPKRFSALAARGFIVVAQDTRGRYTSDGVAVPHDEARDGYDSVEWAAKLPGSNGRVGMFGGSYLATTQLEAATTQPPSLKALFPASSYARRHDMVFQGGAFYLSDGLSWNLGQAVDVRRRVLTPSVDRDGPIGLDAEQRQTLRNTWYWHLPLKSFNELDLRRFAPGYFQMLDHPSFDGFWDPADIEKRHDQFQVPAFHLTGWYDTLLTGTLKNFTGLRAHAATETARKYQRLIIGPWTHARPTLASTSIGDVSFGPNAGYDSEGAMVRWFDYWLKDGDRAAIDTAPVRLFVMGANEWRDEQEWPLARAKQTAYYLSSGGRANTAAGDGVLSTGAPAPRSAPDTYSYNPNDPVPTGASGGYSRNPADQRAVEQRPDVLVYTSAPLAEDLEVTGPLALTLWIRSSAKDTDFTGKLVDVFPDGTARPLADGILRARYRQGPTAPVLLTPGEPTEITIDLGATSNLFKAGHRIRLEVSSSNFPRFDRNPNTGGTFGEDRDVVQAEQTVLHDAAHPSRLILPVVGDSPRVTGTVPALQLSQGLSPAADASFLVTNARLIDGTGSPARAAAVRVTNGKIAEVGALTPAQGERVIDAGGLVLAPGFIDPHNHSTDGLLTEPLAASQVSQGITTLFVGQDGSSPWPIADYLSKLRAAPPAVNVLTAVGHATVRQLVMGEDYKRVARPDEVAKMEALVDQGMREGAIALSSGLEYEVGSYSNTDEVVALARVAAKYKGIYISHTRDEADKSFDSIREIIAIAERAKIPVQNTHIKLGTQGVWHKAPEAIRLLDQARARGLDVTADVYPYDAWSSTITVLIPSKRYDDPEAVTQGLNDVGGAGNILITRHAAHPDYEFKTLADVAKARNITPVQAFIQIVKDGGASVVCTAMVDDDIRAFVRWPHAMFSSDGGIGMRHPRGAGSFPRVLGLFVRERKWLTLEEAIRKMTSLTAARLSLADRGTVKPGNWADLVLLDPDTVIDRSTFSDPFILSTGIRKVWVNGALVWNEGATAGARPGMVLTQSTRSGAVVYEGARIIDGNGGPPIENGVLVIQDGRVTAVGARGAVQAPAGAGRVDVAGKTIMPAMINAHVHMGYEAYTSWGARNHTPENLVDHLQREAWYGVAAATSVGSSPVEMSLQFQRDQQAGKFPPVARYLFMPGMAPPNGGPDHILRVATNELHVVNEVTTPAEARAAVQRMDKQGIRHVKLWYDDRNKTYPKLAPEVMQAIVDEAHAHKMTVHAHAIQLADQKAVVAAGADVVVHMVQRQPLDDEYLALLRQKRPYWATVITLGEPVEVCNKDPFFEDALPPSVVAKIRATMERASLVPSCGPLPANWGEREKQMAINFPQMIKAGVKLVLATDTGIHPGHTFGSGEHAELARWVQLGLSPADAIVAATKTPAELMGLTDLGTLAPGKRASFIVLDANPLENIRNTRKIADVYLDGARFDRAAVRAKWRALK